MSISKETVNNHKNDPAVVCCLTKEGTTISPADLEDPVIFADLEDSGLLVLTDNVLNIGQVIGAKLTKTIDALTPITADAVEGATTVAEGNETVAAKDEKDGKHTEQIPVGPTAGDTSSQIDISIGEGRDIKLSIVFGSGGAVTVTPTADATAAVNTVAKEDQIIRTLKQREFAVEKVELGEETSFQDGVLIIRTELATDIPKADPLVKKVEIDIINPDSRHVHTNTILDVVPIAAKVEGELGEGITNIINNAVFVLTGVDEGGAQIHEFGTCEGFMDETIEYGRPGAPDRHDIMIRVHIVLQKNTGMERRGPTAAHKACDTIIQEIREALKKAPASESEKENEFRDIKRQGLPRVVLVKEIMGQGAMHDNVLMPHEPAGVRGGRHNFDLGNVPIMLSPNQVRDGGVHSMCCVGPADKEVTRHYFREPLVKAMVDDEEIDLVGVIFVGSPQANDEKLFVAERLGSWVEALDIEGAIVTTEGFGNNHIDFAAHIEQIGKRGIAVVGVCFSAYQGTLVIGNQYMDAMIETNKEENGMEAQKLAVSTICPEDADRALLMLKTKMAGVPIQGPERKWNQSVVIANQKIADETLGR